MKRLLLILTLVFSGALAAKSEEDARYVTLQPTFVTNYGFSENGRLKYLKADVTVRVSSHDAEMALRNHFPYLRNNLVLLFSRQDEASVSSREGREVLREEALAELRAVMEAEEGETYIEDLMFSNFVVQR